MYPQMDGNGLFSWLKPGLAVASQVSNTVLPMFKQILPAIAPILGKAVEQKTGSKLAGDLVTASAQQVSQIKGSGKAPAKKKKLSDAQLKASEYISSRSRSRLQSLAGQGPRLAGQGPRLIGDGPRLTGQGPRLAGGNADIANNVITR